MARARPQAGHSSTTWSPGCCRSGSARVGVPLQPRVQAGPGLLDVGRYTAGADRWQAEPIPGPGGAHRRDVGLTDVDELLAAAGAGLLNADTAQRARHRGCLVDALARRLRPQALAASRDMHDLAGVMSGGMSVARRAGVAGVSSLPCHGLGAVRGAVVPGGRDSRPEPAPPPPTGHGSGCPVVTASPYRPGLTRHLTRRGVGLQGRRPQRQQRATHAAAGERSRSTR